jgi:hypothetical protein
VPADALRSAARRSATLPAPDGIGPQLMHRTEVNGNRVRLYPLLTRVCICFESGGWHDRGRLALRGDVTADGRR